jgi:hypothetical protein
MSSDTSDPVVLDHPTEEETSQPTRPPPITRQSTLTPKKCWICICDVTEDDPNNPPVWRTPCACNLTAHETCLLDWVADLENPQKKDRPADNKIRCPQCKTEIKVARPRSLVLNATQGLNRILARAVLPGLGFSLGATIFAGCWVHGFQSVYIVFGPRHAEKLFFEAQPHQRFFYALIPFNLIFARTSFADSTLATGTFALLSTQIDPYNFELDMILWPPKPSTVFIILPTIRRAYNWAYQQAFGDFNRRMIEAVQPVLTQPMEGEEVAQLAELDHEEPAEGQVLLEIEINGGGEDEEDVGEAGGNAQNGPNNGNQQNNPGHVHQVQEIVETFGIGSTILGALVFPTVAAGMGQLLSCVLPKSWMGPANTMNGRPGLLRHRWGRSVVGGAIFVVLKDALLLYARYKRAQTHRQRRIVDYDKKKKVYLE